jgi:hypothetical protein
MKNYNFEYTSTKFTLKLLGLSFLAFIVLLIAMVVTIDLIGIIGSLIVAFGVPFFIFYLNKKKIKKTGAASLFDSYVEFKLAESSEKIKFEQIKTYQVERYNGTALTIKLNDGNNFKLRANINFCHPGQFDFFCQELEKVLQQYKTSNNVSLTREKSMFEKAWMLPFLIVTTTGLIGGIAFAISQGKAIPPTFYTLSAVIISFWIGYLTIRNGKRKKQKIEEENKAMLDTPDK